MISPLEKNKVVKLELKKLKEKIGRVIEEKRINILLLKYWAMFMSFQYNQWVAIPMTKHEKTTPTAPKSAQKYPRKFAFAKPEVWGFFHQYCAT